MGVRLIQRHRLARVSGPNPAHSGMRGNPESGPFRAAKGVRFDEQAVSFLFCVMQISRRNPPLLRQTMQTIQMAFPQIYLACHTRHERKRSNANRLSTRDAAILAHLDQSVAVTPSKLASHLGVSRSTLSEALKRLAALGLVAVPAEVGPGRRRVSVVLTDAGALAVSDTSVLETKRLEKVLARTTARELKTVSAGISILASACRSYSENARRLRRTPK